MREKDRAILAIDLKSFYASVECVDRGLDPFTTPLVVCDRTRSENTIILAVSPYCKSLGIPSRLRLKDLPKVKGMIYAMPRMERYIRKSVEVLSIYLDYVDKSDMHVYSQDEAFLDVTDYLEAAGCDKLTYAKRIIRDVYKKTGLTVTAGIGTNLFMAKACMDIEAKHKKDFIASWEEEDIPLHLWPVHPLSKMWGIGKRMEQRLNALGFQTVGDIACADPFFLESEFGVIGREIYEHANGRDESRIQKPYAAENRSLGLGQVLMKDYTIEEARTVILESLNELIGRLRKNHVLAGMISLYIGYAENGGCGASFPLMNPTRDKEVLEQALMQIVGRCYDGKSLIRNICLQANELSDDRLLQLSLFPEDNEEYQEEQKVSDVTERIRKCYGKASVIPASALLKESTLLRRFSQIGGHRK